MVIKLLKGSEVAQILGISRSQAYTLMRNGSIEVVRFDRSVRVSEEALYRFINRNTIEANSLDNTTKILSPATSSLDNLKSYSNMAAHNDR